MNPLAQDYLDYDNPSLSSDDTLALHSTASPLPPENGEGLVRTLMGKGEGLGEVHTPVGEGLVRTPM